MADVLLINPPSAFSSYKGTKITAFVQRYPVLSLACLAAVLREKGFRVSILDLGLEDNPFQVLDITLDEMKPRIVGISSTTPLYFEAAEISKMLKRD